MSKNNFGEVTDTDTEIAQLRVMVEQKTREIDQLTQHNDLLSQDLLGEAYPALISAQKWLSIFVANSPSRFGGEERLGQKLDQALKTIRDRMIS